MKLYLGLMVLVATTVAACDSGKKNGGRGGQGAQMGEQPEPLVKLERNRIPVQTAKIVRRNIQNTYRASAVLEAERDVELLVKEDGVIDKVNFLAGDKVKKGQVIASIAAPILKSRLNKARIAYADKQRLYKASESLYQKKHIARDRFEEARIALETAKIAYEDAKRSVEHLTLKAPFDGQVVHNYLQVGAHSSTFKSNAPIRVVADDKLKATFAIPVLHVGNIKTGMTLNLHNRGVSGNAVVSRISPVVDKDTGTVLVYFDADNSNHVFLSGERVTLEVPLGEASERLILPENSVIFEGDQPFVYLTRLPTDKEVEADLSQLMGKGGGKGDKKDSKDSKENAPENGEALADAKENSEEEKNKAKEKKELLLALKQVPRAQKVGVEIEQMANGEYALSGIQQGKAKNLSEGSDVVVIGLYHMADDAKLKLLENL